MKEVIGAVAVGVICVAGIGALAVATNEFAFRTEAHYAPRYEDVRRTTFEHSRAFQEGTLRDLDNLRLEYDRSDDAHKETIADIARHRLADIDIEALPPQTRAFALKVEGAR